MSMNKIMLFETLSKLKLKSPSIIQFVIVAFLTLKEVSKLSNSFKNTVSLTDPFGGRFTQRTII